MKHILPFLIACVALIAACFLSNAADPSTAFKPLKVLLVCGGCCHDYEKQKEILKTGIESRLNAVVDVVYNPDTSTKATFEIYHSKEWAKGFDVVIHDECSADVADAAYVANILDAHRAGTPAVNLHCAMHSYRWGNFREPVNAGADNAGWFEFLGMQSTAHGPQEPIRITYTDKESPITRGLEDWTTIQEELYNNVQVLTGKSIASGSQLTMPKAKKDRTLPPATKPVEMNAVVAWTNEYGDKKTRIFSTSLGHNNETVADDRYLDLIARGLLWATGKLDADGKPLPGYGK